MERAEVARDRDGREPARGALRRGDRLRRPRSSRAGATPRATRARSRRSPRCAARTSSWLPDAVADELAAERVPVSATRALARRRRRPRLADGAGGRAQAPRGRARRRRGVQDGAAPARHLAAVDEQRARLRARGRGPRRRAGRGSRRGARALGCDATLVPTRHPVVDIVPFQLLTVDLAGARGVDPDPIRRDDDRAGPAPGGVRVKLEQAQAIVRHVVESAPGPVSVYVADDHGELVAAATMDGAAPDTRLNAERKAYTAARSDAETTRALAEKVRDDPAELASFDPKFMLLQRRRGGVRGRPPRRRRRRQRPAGRRRRSARRGGDPRRRARTRRRLVSSGSGRVQPASLLVRRGRRDHEVRIHARESRTPPRRLGARPASKSRKREAESDATISTSAIQRQLQPVGQRDR